MTKQCCRCKKTKDVSEFYSFFDKSRNHVRLRNCLDCERSEWKEKKKIMREKDRLGYNKKMKEWRDNNPAKASESAKNCRRRTRMLVLEHYGGTPPRCACCGEMDAHFLSIDHINNDGAISRKIHGTGQQYLAKLVKRGYPTGYQVLCHNCNLAKGFYGKCPHTDETMIFAVPLKCNTKGIRHSIKTEFKKGLIPWNKGKKGYTNKKPEQKVEVSLIDEQRVAHVTGGF